jgi:hypothetical protein
MWHSIIRSGILAHVLSGFYLTCLSGFLPDTYSRILPRTLSDSFPDISCVIFADIPPDIFSDISSAIWQACILAFYFYPSWHSVCYFFWLLDPGSGPTRRPTWAGKLAACVRAFVRDVLLKFRGPHLAGEEFGEAANHHKKSKSDRSGWQGNRHRYWRWRKKVTVLGIPNLLSSNGKDHLKDKREEQTR